MFPTDTITLYKEINGVGAFNLASSTRTILGVSIQQSGVASNSWIECSGQIIALNYSKDLAFNPINYLCNGALTMAKTGNDKASFIVTYVPRDTASTTNISTTLENIELKVGGLVGYRDWLFSTQVDLFLLSFIAIGILFSFFNRKR